MSAGTQPKAPSMLTVETFIKIVLAPSLSILAGYGATLVARYFPGVKVDQNQLVWVFIVGLAAAALLIWKSLDKLTVFQHLAVDLEPVLGHMEAIPGIGEDVLKLIDMYGPDIISDLHGLLADKAAALPTPEPFTTTLPDA